jgi:hypothetical protein
VSGRLEEFDLDVRLHGMSVERGLQADTEKEECGRRTDENTCDGVALTCNTCTPTCGGDTQCESARVPISLRWKRVAQARTKRAISKYVLSRIPLTAVTTTPTPPDAGRPVPPSREG